jgi:N-acyl-D-aspartate/D-glutamate deacylase
MCAIVVDAMEAGACGFSTQLMGERGVQRDYDGTPMLTDTRSLDELAAFARAMGSTGRGFFQLTGTLEATELVARESGRPALFNVLTIMPGGQDQHGQPLHTMEKTMAFLDRAHAEGLRIYAQGVTNPTETRFTLEDYNLFDSSALWCEATLGTVAERLAKLADPDRRAALRADFDERFTPEASQVGTGPATIPGFALRAVPDDAPERFRPLVGRTIGEIAETSGTHPVDVLLDVACATKLRAEFQNVVGPKSAQDLDKMRTLVRYRYAVPGVSDGGAHTKFFTLASFPTQYLAEWVRDHEMIDLEEAHWRLSAYPAHISGITDRGYLREGAPADLVVYDLDHLAERPSERAYDFPGGQWRLVRKATGYRYTIVNGEVTFEDGEPTGAVSGHLLRHGADRTPALV